MSSSLSDRLRQLAGDEPDFAPSPPQPSRKRASRPNAPDNTYADAETDHDISNDAPDSANDHEPANDDARNFNAHNNDQTDNTEADDHETNIDISNDLARAADTSSRSSSHRSQSRPRRSPTPQNNHDQLKLMAVPILITIGLLLFIPFTWAIMLLAGIITNERDGAQGMAMLMLVTGPLAFILIAGAAFFLWQVKRHKK